jgi:hypothetical protein
MNTRWATLSVPITIVKKEIVMVAMEDATHVKVRVWWKIRYGPSHKLSNHVFPWECGGHLLTFMTGLVLERNG